MHYEPGTLDQAIAAAVGDDPQLILELRTAFIVSAEQQIDLMRRARCDANWHVAALQLEGLAASFAMVELQALARDAAHGAPGDPAILRRIIRVVDNLAAIVR